MKRIYILAVAIFLGFSLSGCAFIDKADEIISNLMLKNSEIQDDDNYRTYQGYKDAGILDDEGFYSVETENEAEESGEIRITFSSNPNLMVTYYADANHEKVINASSYYANHGDNIYADVAVVENAPSSEYKFLCFRVFEYNDQGERTEREDLQGDFDATGIVLQIPSDFAGHDLSIDPVGEFPMRMIHMNDYYIDESDNKQKLSGTWIVNDKVCTEDESIEINSMSSYIISYQYDSNDYFYVSSSPDCYYHDNDGGVVIFNQRTATDNTEEYSVELHEYLSVTLVADTNRTITINNEPAQFVKANNEFVVSHLRYGESVTLKTNKEWPDLKTNRDLIYIDEKKSGNNYIYTLIVPEKGGEFVFNPLDYIYDHGTIIFSCFGSRVTYTQILAKGSRIYYEQGSADEGYWLAGSKDSHYITVGDEEETRQQLEDIHFTPKVQVTLNLPQPEYGGTITYKTNKGVIDSDVYQTYSGTKITMDFNAWEGWKTEYKSGVEYSVGEKSDQTVTVAGKNVNSIFTEDEDHKPALTVILEKSVGEQMKFLISAAGLSKQEYSYGKDSGDAGFSIGDLNTYDIISKNKTVIDKQKIGTEAGIEIIMSNRALKSGTAVRILIDRVDRDGNKTSEIIFSDDLTEAIPVINIYKDGNNTTSPIWYRTITIKIGVVDVVTHTEADAGNHTSIAVKEIDTNRLLNSGDFIESSQTVGVTIKPSSGYYLSGKNIKSGLYYKAMKYADYQKNINSIIAEHPAQKYRQISLDASDTFAEYTYKLAGKKVAGSIEAEIGQKLELTYEIKEAGYKLKKAGEDLITPLNNIKTTQTLVITEEMDGITLTKENFNIYVEEGE